MINFSIAIPTYNGAKRLEKLLESLRLQQIAESITWEIIIVDNNSTDNTSEVISNIQKSFNRCPLSYFLERQQGVSFARIRAVKEARGELIGFLDDDNLPASNWVQESIAFGALYPDAGAWGGQIHGEFEVSPLTNFKKIQGFLAIRERGSLPILYDPNNLSLPPGAGLVVRKQVWSDHVPSSPVLRGKLPGLMIHGDDYESLLYIHKAGREIWYNPKMHTFHQIPPWRLEKDYLLTLARGSGLCIFQLRLINAKSWQKPILFIRTFFGNFLRALHHLIKYRSQLHYDLVSRFELEFYLSSMISPLYWLTKTILAPLNKRDR